MSQVHPCRHCRALGLWDVYPLDITIDRIRVYYCRLVLAAVASLDTGRCQELLADVGTWSGVASVMLLRDGEACSCMLP